MNEAILNRAIKAYSRENMDQPCHSLSTVDGNLVTLRNVNGDLATYRYRPGSNRLVRVDA